MQEARNYDECRCAQSITTDFLVENNLELQSRIWKSKWTANIQQYLLSYSTIVSWTLKTVMLMQNTKVRCQQKDSSRPGQRPFVTQAMLHLSHNMSEGILRCSLVSESWAPQFKALAHLNDRPIIFSSKHTKAQCGLAYRIPQPKKLTSDVL
jgi:hypothetical protein